MSRYKWPKFRFETGHDHVEFRIFLDDEELLGVQSVTLRGAVGEFTQVDIQFLADAEADGEVGIVRRSDDELAT